MSGTCPPDTGEDPRQSIFRDTIGRAISELATDEETESVFMVPLKGFPASYVDLGWLQSKMREYFRESNPKPDELSELVREELGEVVQRVKSIAVGLDNWPVVRIRFESKDDESSYFYEFAVLLEV